MPQEKLLVLSVDRDNDIGLKVGRKGPITGKEDILKTAQHLGLKDPEDSDVNTLYQTIRVWEEVKKNYNARAVVLTGDRSVGMASDQEIGKQLDQVLKKFPAEGAILVTDGAEDEHIMPIVQSKLPILSVNRLVVKQAERLESTYYKIKDFIDESLENPKYARLVFGLPSIILLLYALFGIEAGRAIIGVLGVYLLIKGFKLEKYVYTAFDELKTAFTRRRFAFFAYTVAIAFGILATFRGYNSLTDWSDVGLFETSAAFVSSSVYFYFLAGTMAWVGRQINMKERVGKKIISVPMFGLAISIVIYTAADMILSTQFSTLNFLSSVILGFFLIFAAVLIELKL